MNALLDILLVLIGLVSFGAGVLWLHELMLDERDRPQRDAVAPDFHRSNVVGLRRRIRGDRSSRK